MTEGPHHIVICCRILDVRATIGEDVYILTSETPHLHDCGTFMEPEVALCIRCTHILHLGALHMLYIAELWCAYLKLCHVLIHYVLLRVHVKQYIECTTLLMVASGNSSMRMSNSRIARGFQLIC